MDSDITSDTAQKEAIRRRIEQWRRAEPVMRKQHREDIRNADTQSAVAWFDGVSRALGPDTTRLDRGLVEQQQWFSRIRWK